MLLGATGDLARKMLFPALLQLAATILPARVIGVAVSAWDDARLRQEGRQSVFADVEVGQHERSRIVIEKPFGRHLRPTGVLAVQAGALNVRCCYGCASGAAAPAPVAPPLRAATRAGCGRRRWRRSTARR